MILEPFVQNRIDLIASPGLSRNFLFYLLYYNYKDNFDISKQNEFFANLYCIHEVEKNLYNLSLYKTFLEKNKDLLIEYKNLSSRNYAGLKNIFDVVRRSPFIFYMDFFMSNYEISDKDKEFKDIDFNIKLKIHNDLFAKLDFSFIDSAPYVCNFHDPYYLSDFDVHIPNYEIVAIEPKDVDSIEQILTLCTIKHIHSNPTLTAEDMFRISKEKQQVFENYKWYTKSPNHLKYIKKVFYWEDLFKNIDWVVWRDFFACFEKEELWNKEETNLRNEILLYSERNNVIYNENRHLFFK